MVVTGETPSSLLADNPRVYGGFNRGGNRARRWRHETVRDVQTHTERDGKGRERRARGPRERAPKRREDHVT